MILIGTDFLIWFLFFKLFKPERNYRETIANKAENPLFIHLV